MLSYFLGSVLDTAGYTHPIQQANITLINSCQQFAFAIFGAMLVDRVGRRPLLLFSFTACTIVWLGMTIASGILSQSQIGVDENDAPIFDNPPASQACLAMIFLFGSVYSVGITPLQALYPVEVLSFEMRAKGMAFSNLAVNAAGLLNQFAWPVSMEKIAWKTYIIFTIWDAIQTLIIWMYIPETKGRTVSPKPARLETQRNMLTRVNSSRSLTTSSPPRTPSRSPQRRSRSPSTATVTLSTSRTFKYPLPLHPRGARDV